jgi:hypothetical protein
LAPMNQELIGSAMELQLPAKYCSSSFELKRFTNAKVYLFRGINSLTMWAFMQFHNSCNFPAKCGTEQSSTV